MKKGRMLCLFVLIVLVSACSSNASRTVSRPAVPGAGPDATTTFTPQAPARAPVAPLAPTLEDRSFDAILASGTATPVRSMASHGDAANGAVLFVKMGCRDCHMPPAKLERKGPDLQQIAADAATYTHATDYHGTATDTASYIRESILKPNAFIVPAFRNRTTNGLSAMPSNFSILLNPEQVDDLVSYVLTLK